MHHQVEIIKATAMHLVLKVDGKEVSFLWGELSPCLENASIKDRSVIEISPSGYGIHWPILDEDLSIDGLLGIKHESQFQQGLA